jgi:hypothetical protein
VDESPVNEAPVAPQPLRTRYALGLLGLLVGVLGLFAAVARPHIAEALKPPKPPEPPPQKLSDTLADAGDKFVDRIIDRLREKKAEPAAKAPPPSPPTPWDLYLAVAATSLGLVGALAGTAGWVRREDHRLAASSIVVGVLALAWVQIVAALVIAFLIVFLLLLGGAIGGMLS